MDPFLREAAAVSDPSAGPSASAVCLRQGEAIADRFVIDRLAGRGGMGAVYKALDRMSGLPVALKVMRGGGQGDERFAREARVLSELNHPAIVRYVAQGTTPDGQPFLAMEWLDGEDLSERLSRTGLTVDESLAVVRRIATGLASTHARGVVHRDVKPSNVFLVGGDPTKAKLLDFGIVRLQSSAHVPTARPMTRTGMIVGTVGYMSPEQAVADRAIDARTDVFALGCVLFECLTGVPAFSGAHVVAVLAKVLRDEAPRLRQLRPDLSNALDELLARTLSKDKTRRPADGSALLQELEALGSLAGGVPELGKPPSPGLSDGEQRLVSVLLTYVPDGSSHVEELIRRHAGEQARLVDGALLVTMSGHGSASEQVVAAAGCAIDLHHAFPSTRIALAIGRTQTMAERALGPVIDQAAALLAHSDAAGIRVDEVTAGLLGGRFELSDEGTGAVLVGRRSALEPPRTLLGKPTPCIGRDKELAVLDLTLQECIDESVARAVLVTGPAGQGKSRLRHEFVIRARERGDVTILSARADPVGAGSSFMMVRQLVRQAAGLRDGRPPAEQHSKLRAHVADRCKCGNFSRVADFLGELVGVSSTDPPSAELVSARNDPQIMAAWLARSFSEWLAAESAARPLLVILEDLHWGDLPSVSYLGDGLRTLQSAPLMVLALARPEVHETFPNFWAAAEKTEVSLGRLIPRAAERLVRTALGESAGPDTIARIVERADGNAFYLEELIRCVAEGTGDTLPDTVLALVQSRLERLEADARRIVRAASVFGEIFWRGGVASLLGPTSDAGHLDAWLRRLAEGELISTTPESRFADRQYVFRHDLLRQAAYAMLTEADRTIGHRLAGEWLEQMGERDALLMADHFERGGEPKRAVPNLARAAQAAYYGVDNQAALALSLRGVACDPDPFDRGLFRLIQGMALSRNDLAASVESLREAMGLLQTGSHQWFLAAGQAFLVGSFLGDPAITGPILQAIVSAQPPSEPSASYGLAIVSTCLGLAAIGQVEFARSVMSQAESVRDAATEPDLVFSRYLCVARGYVEYFDDRIGSALESMRDAQRLSDSLGEVMGGAFAMLLAVGVLSEAGHCEQAEAAFHKVVAFCKGQVDTICDWATLHLATALNLGGRASEAANSVSRLLEHKDRHLACSARVVMAAALEQSGDFAAAGREAARSLEEAGPFANVTACACGILSLLRLRAGQPNEALAFAARSREAGGTTFMRTRGLLMRAEALHALGDKNAAHVAIRDVRDRVLRVASAFDADPDLRAAYLSVHDNVRALELAREWLNEPGV